MKTILASLFLLATSAHAEDLLELGVLDWQNFSADGSVLVGFQQATQFHAWDMNTGQKLSDFGIPGRTAIDLSAFAVSPKGDHTVTVYDDLSVLVWNNQTGAEVLRGSLPQFGNSNHYNGARPLVWAPDGRRFAARVRRPDHVCVFNLNDGSRTCRAEPAVWEFAFLSDSETLLTLDHDDCTLRHWNVRTLVSTDVANFNPDYSEGCHFFNPSSGRDLIMMGVQKIYRGPVSTFVADARAGTIAEPLPSLMTPQYWMFASAPVSFDGLSFMAFDETRAGLCAVRLGQPQVQTFCVLGRFYDSMNSQWALSHGGRWLATSLGTVVGTGFVEIRDTLTGTVTTHANPEPRIDRLSFTASGDLVIVAHDSALKRARIMRLGLLD